MFKRLTGGLLAASLCLGLFTSLPSCVPGTSFFDPPAAQVMNNVLSSVSFRVFTLEEKAESEGLTKAEKKELRHLRKIDGHTEKLFDPDTSTVKQIKLMARLLKDVRKANSPDSNIAITTDQMVAFMFYLLTELQSDTSAFQTDVTEKQGKLLDRLGDKASRTWSKIDDAREAGKDKKAEKLAFKANKFQAKARDKAEKFVQ